MNNSAMYRLEDAGGIPYPETAKYHYDKWYTTTGLTDGNAYKTIRFNIRQDNLLLHWTNYFLVLDGKLVKKADSTAFGNDDEIFLVHNAIPHLFSNVKLTIGNQLVENINQVGYVSSMMYNVLYSCSKGKSDGLLFIRERLLQTLRTKVLQYEGILSLLNLIPMENLHYEFRFICSLNLWRTLWY